MWAVVFKLWGTWKGWPSHSGSKNNYSCFTDEEDWGLLEVQSTALAPSAPESSMQVPQDGEDFVGQPWYHGPLSRQVPLPLTGPHTIWWGNLTHLWLTGDSWVPDKGLRVKIYQKEWLEGWGLFCNLVYVGCHFLSLNYYFLWDGVEEGDRSWRGANQTAGATWNRKIYILPLKKTCGK